MAQRVEKSGKTESQKPQASEAPAVSEADIDLQKQIAELRRQNSELATQNAQLEAHRNGEGSEIHGNAQRIARTQSAGREGKEVTQWPFQVHAKGSRVVDGKAVAVTLKTALVSACDESEAIRLYTLCEPGDDGKLSGERQHALDPSAWRFYARCTDPKREKLRRAKYEARGYGKPDTLPIPSGIGYAETAEELRGG